jgi:hypothetical protein
MNQKLEIKLRYNKSLQLTFASAARRQTQLSSIR